LKKPFTKKREGGAGRVAQGRGPEFKPQYCKERKASQKEPQKYDLFLKGTQ
jgi:hypothetical protein